ncbi:SAV_2336 N-terminal domain-related protein [Actinoplanes utahensis]|uniref:SAV_2336 N-terminal domain-related protein n=1 Tax=Actinoplanes utahensis TaxID=1869 RepID=UPI000691FEB2|nr:SAV_2336 N-terminal domain-related protein [Actinoplanes utahensis]GIF31608.1 hypothetical protein Aut01nite_45940 [Actinoplanes utahensis]
MFADIVTALRAAGLQPTAVDVAEMLWLAWIIDSPVTPHTPARVEPAPHTAPSTGPARPMPVAAAESAAAAADLHPYTSDQEPDGEAVDALRLRSPGVPALPHALALGRALRPLRRRTPSSHLFDVDEDETAARIAQDRLWIPVLRPRLEPAADLAVIVDSSSSMAIWGPTVRELLLLTQRLGAFRAIRGHTVDSDSAGDLTLLPLGARVASAMDADAITDPTGRLLMLVVTDGIGAAWHDGRMHAQLRRWATANRIQVLCLLPRRMWRSTGLRTRTATGDPAAPAEERNAVPVLELSLTAIRRRAAMIGRAEGAAVLLPPDPTTREPGPTDPAELVRRFLSLASPTAQQLAGYLAAAPLTLPAMRLVQRVMLPRSAPTHLAEVYLSGLIQQRGATGPGADIETVRFDFLPGVRELLLDGTDRAGAVRVLSLMSRYVTDRFGRQALDFPALLRAPETAEIPELGAGAWPIAQIAAPVLRGLGPRFALLADRLEAQARIAAAANRSNLPAEPEPASPRARVGFHVAPVDATSRREDHRLLGAVLDEIFEGLVADGDGTERIHLGRGMAVILPPYIEPRSALEFVLTTATRHLQRLNAGRADALRLRLCVSAAVASALGDMERLLADMLRLQHCGALREVMAARPDLDLAAAISDDLYAATVRNDQQPHSVFQQASLDPGVAWLWTGVLEPSEIAASESADTGVLSRLTPRQREVLAGVAQGLDDDEIAWNLHISPRTVSSHLRGVYQSLGVRTRTQAVLKYLEVKAEHFPRDASDPARATQDQPSAPRLVARDGSWLVMLNDRELEVLIAMAQGLGNGDIARRLSISERTVSSHAGHVYRKLGVRNRVEAVLFYLTETSPPVSMESSPVPEENALVATQRKVWSLRALARDDPDEHLPELALELGVLAIKLRDAGRSAEAVTAAEESVEIGRRVADQRPGSHQGTLAILARNLGKVYETVGQPDRAITVYTAAIADGEAHLGPDDFNVLNVKRGLADVYRIVGRSAEAIALYEGVLAGCDPRFSPVDPYNLDTRSRLAGTLEAAGELEQALYHYGRLSKLQREGGHRADEAITLTAIGRLHEALGEHQRALVDHRQALRIRREMQDRAGEAETRYGIAMIHRQLGDFDAAIAELEEAVRIGDAPATLTTRLQQLRRERDGIGMPPGFLLAITIDLGEDRAHLLERQVRRLRDDLAQLDVGWVRFPSESVPPADSGAGTRATGILMVEVSPPPSRMREVFDVLVAWSRRSGGKVTVANGNDAIVVDAAGPEEMERLIDRFVEQQTA